MSEVTNPNCAIVVHYYEADDRFSYFCSACSRGWQVQPDGSIHPPSTSRVIQFSVKGFPSAIVFGGFQVASDPSAFPPKTTPWSALPTGLKVASPSSYPTGNQTTSGPLVFDLEHQATEFFYRLAVVGIQGGVLHWDEPKIYDNGTQ